MHGVVYGRTPRYLSDMVSHLPGRAHLRSAQRGHFDVPRSPTVFGSSSFSVALRKPGMNCQLTSVTSPPSWHSSDILRRFYLKLYIHYNNIYFHQCNFVFYLLFILVRLVLHSLIVIVLLLLSAPVHSVGGAIENFVVIVILIAQRTRSMRAVWRASTATSTASASILRWFRWLTIGRSTWILNRREYTRLPESTAGNASCSTDFPDICKFACFCCLSWPHNIKKSCKTCTAVAALIKIVFSLQPMTA